MEDTWTADRVRMRRHGDSVGKIFINGDAVSRFGKESQRDSGAYGNPRGRFLETPPTPAACIHWLYLRYSPGWFGQFRTGGRGFHVGRYTIAEDLRFDGVHTAEAAAELDGSEQKI